jgi:hypothetical protein
MKFYKFIIYDRLWEWNNNANSKKPKDENIESFHQYIF